MWIVCMHHGRRWVAKAKRIGNAPTGRFAYGRRSVVGTRLHGTVHRRIVQRACRVVQRGTQDASESKRPPHKPPHRLSEPRFLYCAVQAEQEELKVISAHAGVAGCCGSRLENFCTKTLLSVDSNSRPSTYSMCVDSPIDDDRAIVCELTISQIYE